MMKKLFVLMLFPCLAFAQTGGEKNFSEFLKQKTTADGGTTYTYNQIFDRSYSGGVTDTTEEIALDQFKIPYLTLFTTDSATILIDYRLSVDKANWTAFTLIDSLSNGTDNNGFKSVDFDSTVIGAKYVQFRFRTSALAFPLGTTSPKYWAYILLRKF